MGKQTVSEGKTIDGNAKCDRSGGFEKSLISSAVWIKQFSMEFLPYKGLGLNR